MQILILEDMPDTQAWLRSACIQAFPGAGIAIAGTVAEAVEYIRLEPVELALVDLKLPDGNGESFLLQLKDTRPACVSLVVTMYASRSHLLPALRAGAHGYVLKDESQTKLARMLKQVMQGELPLSANAARIVLSQFTQSPNQGKESLLTERESQVLYALADGTSTPQIAIDLKISKYTVEDHVKSIYRKLGVVNRTQAVLCAYKLGLLPLL